MVHVLHRQETIDGVTTKFDVEWWEVRQLRDKELKRTDFWALKDLVMSQAKKDYRKFLRDMPSTYSTANEAADAWAAYEIPE
tara:strand:- start:278 stop:523 length:246 start_codon:yes stop_codon:yes gene_type:complete